MSADGPDAPEGGAGGVKLKGGALRVRDALAALGRDFQVRAFPEGTRTAEDAAAAIGCSVAQIAKSLVFRGGESGRPVLIIASGSNRVDERKAAALLGESVERADAAFVRERTGFAIGGVPPLAHAEPPLTLIDEDLLAHGEIWAAAGTPNAVFSLTPDDLVAITEGRVGDLKRG